MEFHIYIYKTDTWLPHGIIRTSETESLSLADVLPTSRSLADVLQLSSCEMYLNPTWQTTEQSANVGISKGFNSFVNLEDPTTVYFIVWLVAHSIWLSENVISVFKLRFLLACVQSAKHHSIEMNHSFFAFCNQLEWRASECCGNTIFLHLLWEGSHTKILFFFLFSIAFLHFVSLVSLLVLSI